MLVIKKINYQFYESNANKILFICLILLIIALRNGSRSWFKIGPFGIQPSEFAKIGLTIFVSKYLSNNDKSIKDIKKGIFPILLIIFLFFGLIML